MGDHTEPTDRPTPDPALDRYAEFASLSFSRPEDGLLAITMSSPGRLNAAGHEMHRDLANVWRAVDRDPDTAVAIIRGDGPAFSAGGDLDLVADMAADFATRIRVLKEARELVYEVIGCSKPIVSSMHGVAVGAGLVAGVLADVSIATRDCRIIDGHTKLGVAAGDHAAIVWPLLIGMAKAKYYLLTCEPMSGEEAERMGLISLVVDDTDELAQRTLQVATRLRDGSQSAIRWTKYALNNWLRQAGPTFDASLALEFMGFSGPDVHEGIAAIKEKRRPRFDGPASE